MDFISGSYDPGDIYLFRGLGKGKYAKRKSIVDENDVPLVHHPIEMAKFSKLERDDYSDHATQLRVASFGSWVSAVDWDADEDLDMLIGSFSGGLFLRENIGTRAEPKYSSESIEIKADGKPLEEDCHAAPVVADWDGDGVFDLVIGSGDGSVGWYKNVGSVSAPKFGERKLLVSPAYARSSVKQAGDEDPHGTIFIQQELQPGEAPMPAARAQICVHDYNGDGMLDLIVGDYSNIDWARELSESEKDESKSNKEEMKVLAGKLKPLQEQLYSEESKDLEEAKKAELEEKYQKVISEYTKLDEKRKSFFAESRSASFVWLYLRKNASEQNTVATAAPESKVFDEQGTDELEDDGPVGFNAKLEKVGEKHKLKVDVQIKSGWHLYASAGSAGTKEVEVTLELPDCVSAEGDWEKPNSTVSLKSPKQKLYKGHVVFVKDLKLEPDSKGEIKVNISYQVCNESMCLPPTTETILVSID